jgi:hypothetical protein
LTVFIRLSDNGGLNVLSVATSTDKFAAFNGEWETVAGADATMIAAAVDDDEVAWGGSGAEGRSEISAL